MDKMVFDFTIWYEAEGGVQHRYVAAFTEREAVEKLENYRSDRIKNGCASFDYNPQPVVKLDYVID